MIVKRSRVCPRGQSRSGLAVAAKASGLAASRGGGPCLREEGFEDAARAPKVGTSRGGGPCLREEGLDAAGASDGAAPRGGGPFPGCAASLGGGSGLREEGSESAEEAGSEVVTLDQAARLLGYTLPEGER